MWPLYASGGASFTPGNASIGHCFTTGLAPKIPIKVPILAQKGAKMAYFRTILGYFGLFLGICAQILLFFPIFFFWCFFFIFVCIFSLNWKFKPSVPELCIFLVN